LGRERVGRGGKSPKKRNLNFVSHNPEPFLAGGGVRAVREGEGGRMGDKKKKRKSNVLEKVG